MPESQVFEVSVERGAKRVFAGAIEWPGWCRSARDEDGALGALAVYGPRYAEVTRGTRLGFRPPTTSSALVVVERATGDATTDFGAPSVAVAVDARPLDPRELSRLVRILRACWSALDRAVEAAADTELRPGPRGGGRGLTAIVAHVAGAEGGYLGHLAARPPKLDENDPFATLAAERAVVVDSLTRAVTEGLPAHGPRGGKIWTPRFFVRRDAWHVLDHAWEIEDRKIAPA